MADILSTFSQTLWNIIPISPYIIILFLLEKMEKEQEIYEMSKTMGLRLSTVIIVYFIIFTIVTILLSPLFLVIFKLLIFQKTDFIIFTIGMIFSTYADLMSQVFFFFAVKSKWFMLIYVLSQTTGIFKSLLLGNNPPSLFYNFMITLIQPKNGFADIVRITAQFESIYPETGLTFSNWQVQNKNNSAFVDVLATIASLLIYTALVFYVWPMNHSKDGTKLNHCYCLFSKK